MQREYINGWGETVNPVNNVFYTPHNLLTASIQFQITSSNTALIGHNLEVYESRT